MPLGVSGATVVLVLCCLPTFASRLPLAVKSVRCGSLTLAITLPCDGSTVLLSHIHLQAVLISDGGAVLLAFTHGVRLPPPRVDRPLNRAVVVSKGGQPGSSWGTFQGACRCIAHDALLATHGPKHVAALLAMHRWPSTSPCQWGNIPQGFTSARITWGLSTAHCRRHLLPCATASASSATQAMAGTTSLPATGNGAH